MLFVTNELTPFGENRTKNFKALSFKYTEDVCLHDGYGGHDDDHNDDDSGDDDDDDDDDHNDDDDDDDDDNDDELEVVELLGRVTSYLIPPSLTSAIVPSYPFYCNSLWNTISDNCNSL